MGGRQQGAARLVLVHLRLLDHRLLDARLLDGVRTEHLREANLGFIKAEGEALKAIVAPWFGTFFWVFGSLSMILVALGMIDYISRIVADVLKTVYLQQSQRWSESRIYFLVVVGTIAAGSVILLSGFNQPLLLLVDRRLPQRHGDVRPRCANQDRQSRRRSAMLSQQTHGRGDQDTRHHDR